MIEDARVLQPEFLPAEVQHRDAEVSHLSHALNPITEGGRAETAFLHGPSGSGKTCISQWTVERLRENVLDMQYQYVNVWENHSRFKVLYELLDGIGETLDIHRKSTPTDVLLDRLHEYEGPTFVVILDEVDQIDDTSLLYDLLRVRELELILIANDQTQFYARLDDRVRSRLSGCETVYFDPYNLNELVSILQARVDSGLADGVISVDAVERIADAAAGDARAGIGILRAAARQAQRDGLDEIPMAVVEGAIPEAETRMRQADLERLNHDQQVLYELIEEAGEISPSELHKRYSETVDDPRTKRTVRTYIEKMQHYNLIDATGEGPARAYTHVE